MLRARIFEIAKEIYYKVGILRDYSYIDTRSMGVRKR